MKTLTSLLTIAEAATDQIETAFEHDLTQDEASELNEKAAITMQLLNNVEAFLKSESSDVSLTKGLPSGDQIERLFGT